MKVKNGMRWLQNFWLPSTTNLLLSSDSKLPTLQYRFASWCNCLNEIMKIAAGREYSKAQLLWHVIISWKVLVFSGHSKEQRRVVARNQTAFFFIFGREFSRPKKKAVWLRETKSRDPPLQASFDVSNLCRIFAWFQNFWLDSSDSCLPNLEMYATWTIIYGELQSFTRTVMKVRILDSGILPSYRWDLELWRTPRG